jgi:6-phosphogluconolactonase (cycloisomerase 2 family)
MAPANNPSWLVLSPDRRFLYAVNENSDGQSDPVGRVTAWRMNPVTGRLAPLNRISSLGADPTHASLSRDGRFLFIANYSGATDPGGTLAVAPIARNGALGPVVQVKTHRASMANPDRQLAPMSIPPSPRPMAVSSLPRIWGPTGSMPMPMTGPRANTRSPP